MTSQVVRDPFATGLAGALQSLWDNLPMVALLLVAGGIVLWLRSIAPSGRGRRRRRR